MTLDPPVGLTLLMWVKSKYLKLKGTLFRFYISNLRPLAKIFFLQADFS